MKTIAVVCTLKEESDSIKSEMEIISVKNITGVDFIMGKMSGNNVVLVTPMLGKVNGAVCTQILIDLYAVDIVINAAAAEVLNSELAANDAVISDDVCYFDFDTSFLGTEKGVIYQMEESFFKADPELIALSSKAFEDSGKNAYVGRIVTGDRLVYDLAEKNEIRNEFKALCIDMQCGAVAHTCYLNKIPFVAVCLLYDKLRVSNLNGSEIFSISEINSFTGNVKKIIDMID